MAKLNAKARNSLPKADFALPGKRGYPIEDRGHAKSALGRVSEFGTPSQKKTVRAKVAKKFPGMELAKMRAPKA